VLASFQLAGIILLVAVLLGLVAGGALILARRRPAPPLEAVSLHLDSRH
jgi:hypothetical protein